MVNSIAESDRGGSHLTDRAQAFLDRLHRAFANALAGQGNHQLIQERSRLLTAATFGIWLMARIDPAAAAEGCDAAAATLRTWQPPAAGAVGQA